MLHSSSFKRRVTTHTRIAVALVTIGPLGIISSGGHAADLSSDLAAIVAVGPGGTGHTAAVAALDRLRRAPSSQLPTILAAMDDAGPLADNWLRGAVESIVDQAQSANEALPKDELEEFLQDTRHDDGARRLAYEILVQADPSAADRIIPEMLHDPAREFRRDAVARLIEKGDAQLDEGDAQAAQTIWRKALSGAVDDDQVKMLAKRLEDQGQSVDLAWHFGFLLRWQLCGPFDNTGGQGFDTAYPPEQAVNFDVRYNGKSGEVAWEEHRSEDPYGKVDLNKELGKASGVVAYAAATFVSEKPVKVELRLGTPNAHKLWVNGELVGMREVYHTGQSIDQYTADAQLKPGKNLILLKLCQNEMTEAWAQVWEFQLRVCNAIGSAVLSTDRPASAASVSRRTDVETR